MMSDKLQWLNQRMRFANTMLAKLRAEQQALDNNSYGYAGDYHNAIMELRLAVRFLFDEVKQEIFTTTGRVVKIVDTPSSQYPNRVNVVGHASDIGVDIDALNFPVRHTKNPPAGDLTGKVFGSLTVVGLSATAKKKWVVRCECGGYELRNAKSLASGYGCEYCGGV